MDSRPPSRYCLPSFWFFILALLPVAVQGQDIFSGFSGLLDLNYSNSSFKTKTSSGDVSKLDTSNYQARCTLTLNTTIFPNLRLYVNGQFQKQLVVTQTEDTKVRTKGHRSFRLSALLLAISLSTQGLAISAGKTPLRSHTPLLSRRSMSNIMGILVGSRRDYHGST